MTENNNFNKKKYTFWTNDPTVLYMNKKYLEFIPTQKMSRIDQLNAITRLAIYCLILAIIFKQSELIVQLPIIVIIFTYLIFIIYDSDIESKQNELSRMNNSNLENFQSNNQLDNKSETKIKIETAIVNDDNSNILTDNYQCSKCDKNKKKIKHSFTDYENYRKSTCRKPSKSNPFMNYTINDFSNENDIEPQACNVEDDEIKEQIDENFKKDLFMDISDLFEKQNSQRQFYSIPGSSVPDTIGFANWLYSPEGNCKSNQLKCVSNEDLRYNR